MKRLLKLIFKDHKNLDSKKEIAERIREVDKEIQEQYDIWNHTNEKVFIDICIFKINGLLALRRFLNKQLR